MKSVGGTPAEKNGRIGPLVLTSGRGLPLAFYAQAVKDYDEFEAMVPRPDPKKFGMYTKDGWVPDPLSPQLIDQQNAYSNLRWAYTIIKTLEPSNIEWTTVNIRAPETWLAVHDEIKATLCYTERGLLLDLVNEANSLDPAKLEQNRETFFQMRELLANSNSQTSEAENTASSKPVSDSVSDHPA